MENLNLKDIAILGLTFLLVYLFYVILFDFIRK